MLVRTYPDSQRVERPEAKEWFEECVKSDSDGHPFSPLENQIRFSFSLTRDPISAFAGLFSLKYAGLSRSPIKGDEETEDWGNICQGHHVH